MRSLRLIRVEMYRFFHSLSIIKYYFWCALAVALLAYFSCYEEGEGAWQFWNEVISVIHYLFAAICVLTAVYVGREFQQKTFYHERMNGYSITQIACSKSVSCGVCGALIITAALSVAMRCLTSDAEGIGFGRIFCLYGIILHICACTVLYILLCRSGFLGGLLTAARLIVLEQCIPHPALEKFYLLKQCERLFLWMEPTEKLAPAVWLSAIMEYVVLIVLLTGRELLFTEKTGKGIHVIE